MRRFTRRNAFARALGAVALGLLLSTFASGVARADSATVTTLDSFPNPSADGETVRLEALIKGGADGAPVGTVDFTEGGNPITGGDDVAVSRFGAGHTWAIGNLHSCVVTASGGVSCVGKGLWGQNGWNDEQDHNVFTDMGLSSIVAVASGFDHSCALDSSGNVSCWGKNVNWELGTNSNVVDHSSTPLSVNLSTAAKAIAAGDVFNCALLVGGTVECWGNNFDGQLGRGTTGGSFNGELPGPVSGLTNVKAITAGSTHACALLNDGTVKCWGSNDSNQIGNNDGGNDALTPVTVSGLSNVIGIAGGNAHSCALLNDGTIKCWGSNFAGQLGDGSTTTSGVPVDVNDPGIVYVAVASGADANHTCGVRDNGTVRCWGLNDDGQLGNGSQSDEHTPVSTTFHAANNVSLGSRSTCVTLIGGGAECSGNNQDGQFGLGYFGDGPVDPDHPENHHTYIVGPISTLSSGELLTYSRAVLNTAALSTGTHNIVATYSGDVGAYSGSSSNTLSQTVGQQASDIVVVADVNPSTFGQSVTFTATVTGGGPTPTGQVTFKIDNVAQNPLADVVGGVATLTTSALSNGAHTIVAVYNGDDAYFGHTSSDLIQTVNQAPGISSADHITFFVNVSNTFTVTASGSPVAAITVASGSLPTGVTLNDNGDGTATLSGTPTATGDSMFTLKAANGVGADATQAFTLSVSKAASAIVVSSNTPTKVGQTATFTATVTGAGATPTGTVTFSIDGVSQSPVAVISGTATLSTNNMTVGNRSIIGVYNGDGNYFGHTSSTVSHMVSKGATTTTLTPMPSDPDAGQSVGLVAHVTINSPASAPLSGTVTFKEGSTVLGTAPVGPGFVQITHAFPLGNHTITAHYDGSSSLNTSTGTTTLHITKTKTSMTLSASPTVAKPGQAIKFTAHLTSTAGTPTGSVTFKNNNTSATLGTVTLSGGNAVLTTKLPLGTFTISANYAGTATFGDTLASRVVTVTPAVGTEQHVATRTSRNQQYPAIARLVSGFIAVWESDGQDGDGYGIYGQRYKSDFTRNGTEFRISTTTAKQQFSSRVAGLSDGGFVVTWQSQSASSTDYNIYAQRYKSDGKKSGGELVVNTSTTGLQSAPAVAGLSDGGFVVTFESPDGTGNGIGVYARAYSKTSTPKAVARVSTTTSGDQAFADVTGLLNGGYVVTWNSPGIDGNGTGIATQRYTAANAKSGGQTVVNTTMAHDQLYPSIAALSDGGYVVVWVSDGEDGSGYGIYSQRYSKTGAKAGAQGRVNTTTANTQWEPVVAGFSDGGFIVMWSSMGQDGSGYGVYGQVYKASGAKVQTEFKVNTYTTNNQWHPAVTGFSNGEAFGVWTSDGQDGSGGGIYGQRLQMPGVK